VPSAALALFAVTLVKARAATRTVQK